MGQPIEIDMCRHMCRLVYSMCVDMYLDSCTDMCIDLRTDIHFGMYHFCHRVGMGLVVDDFERVVSCLYAVPHW